jgi:hypothetical protein
VDKLTAVKRLEGWSVTHPVKALNRAISCSWVYPNRRVETEDQAVVTQSARFRGHGDRAFRAARHYVARKVIMAGVSRRDFLQHASGAAAALTFMIANGITLDASPLGLPIGSQMWPHRARIGTDGYDGLAAVLKDLKGVGIESVELVSPSGEFQALTDGKRVRKILDDSGIKSPSAHFRGVRTNLPTLIQWAHDIGMTHMSMASMSGPLVNNVTTLEAVKQTCEEYNKLGAIAKKEGLQMMTHNEGFENSRLNDGRLTYPVLLEYLDPDLMKMQFQMSSMATIGDPIMYFTMYPGRFASAHLQGATRRQA